MAKALRSRRCDAATLLAISLVALVALAGCAAEPAGLPPAAESRSRLVTEIDWENDVTIETLRQSVHGELDCSDCHLPAPGDTASVKSYKGEIQCRGCHEKSETVYDQSVHGKSRGKGKEGAARCQDCHGAHDVFPAKDARSLVSQRKLPATCARCHDNPRFADKISPDGGAGPSVRHYAESIHGEILLKKRTVVAPSCVDCHGGHEVAAVKDEASLVSRKNIVKTCGDCHEGIVRKLGASAHGKALTDGDPEAPVCTSCHTAHTIEKAGTSFKLASDQRCGKCHEEQLKDHLGTYHGRAHALGGSDVAACYDCHGSHETLPSKDPGSKVSAANKLDTCRSCHEGAPENFAGYLAHGSSSDKAEYPLLYWTARPLALLLWGAVAMFGAHALLWLGRSLFAFLAGPRNYLAERQRRLRLHAARYPHRFRGVDVFCHVLLIGSFTLLIATGMPLKFHQTEWARVFFGLLGGADVARAIHKLGALMTFSYLLIHLASLIGPLWRSRDELADEHGKLRGRKVLGYLFRPDSPLPGPSDWTAFWKHVRWFLGRGPEPTFGRYRYWEKLDWLALFAGIAIVGATGLVTWLPETFTRVLPGWVVNVAQAIHSGEALIAASFLFIVHLFHFLPRAIGARRKRLERLDRLDSEYPAILGR